MKTKNASVLSTAAACALLAAAAAHHAAAQNLTVQTSNGNSPYAITSGTQTFANVIVGDTSEGVINQSGGTLGVTTSLILSNRSGVGTYNLSGTGVLNIADNGFLVGGVQTSSFVQSGSSAVNASTADLSIRSGSTYSLGGTATLNARTLDAAADGAGNTFAQTGGTAVFGSVRTDDSAVLNLSGGAFTSTGSLVLGSGNTGNNVANQSGTSAVTAGNVVLGDAEVSPFNLPRFGMGTYNLNGGTLTAGSITTVAVTGGSGTGTLNLNGGTLIPSAASATFINAVTRTNVRNGGALINTNGFNVTVPQALLHSNVAGDNATDGGLTKLGAGTLTLTGANTYTGATTVNAGTLQAGSTSAFGNNSTVTMANAAGATLDLNNFNTQIGVLNGGGSAGGNVILGSATLTVNGPTSGTPLGTFAGSISGTGGLTNNGNNQLTLSGTNTYSGPTAVNGGRLQVNGSISGAGPVTVASGATLSGRGTIAGAVTVQAGILAPSVSGTSTLTLGSSLTLTGTATANFFLIGTMAGSEYAQVRVAGQIDLGSNATLKLNLGEFTPAAGDRFYLLDSTGTQAAVLGTFANAPTTGSIFMQQGVSYLINYADHDPADASNALFNDVSVTVVPEPSTWALLLGGAGVFALVRFRKAKAATTLQN